MQVTIVREASGQIGGQRINLVLTSKLGLFIGLLRVNLALILMHHCGHFALLLVIWKTGMKDRGLVDELHGT
jgi:hypothetical protein